MNETTADLIYIVEEDALARAQIEAVLRAQGAQNRLPPFQILADEADIEAGAKAHALRPERPCRMGALIDGLLRLQKGRANEAGQRLGPFLFFAQERYLKRGAEVIELTDKECAILALLCAAQGACVERDVLLKEVWGYVEGLETHTLETHIYRLRQKIEDEPGAPVLLLTEGSGYRLAF